MLFRAATLKKEGKQPPRHKFELTDDSLHLDNRLRLAEAH